MKKRFFSVAMAATIAASILLSSCIGSFGLSNKLFSWNKGVSDSKFVNELVFFAMVVIPVYEVTLFVDGLVLNSIEFWSGNNPVVGEVKTVKGEKGLYTVETLENGYLIRNQDGASINLVLEDESNVWSVVSGGQSIKLLKLVDDEHAIVYLPGNSEVNVPLTEAGVLAFRQAFDETNYLAVK